MDITVKCDFCKQVKSTQVVRKIPEELAIEEYICIECNQEKNLLN